MIIVSKYILMLFGIYIISIGILMLVSPLSARNALRKAGSTNMIHFGELITRMIPATAFILYSNQTPYPIFLKIFGSFMIGTSLALMLFPKKLHHNYANTCADRLKPIYIRLLGPISIILGWFIVELVV